MKDYSGRTCGLVPQIQQDLNATNRDSEEFLVTAKAVTALVNALAESRVWRMEVEDRGDTALVRFVRRSRAEEDPLNII